MFTEPHCPVSFVYHINLLFCESHAFAVGPFFTELQQIAGSFSIVLGQPMHILVLLIFLLLWSVIVWLFDEGTY